MLPHSGLAWEWLHSWVILRLGVVVLFDQGLRAWGAHTLLRKDKIVCQPVILTRGSQALGFGFTSFVIYSHTLGFVLSDSPLC